jgi:hypothetical protein
VIASNEPTMMQRASDAIMGYLSAYAQRHVASVVDLDQATISRRTTQAHDGEREAGASFNAAQVWAMLCSDPEILGRLIADATNPGESEHGITEAVMDHLQIALAAASAATQAMHPASPGGIQVTAGEVDDLLPILRRLLTATAAALHRLEQR